MHVAHGSAHYAEQRVDQGIDREDPQPPPSRRPVREREKPQHQHDGRYYHVIEHLIETAHRVVGVVPLEGRREAHGYARGVDHAGDEYVGGGKRPYQRIVSHLLRALHPERSEPRAYQIDVDEDVGLDGEEGEDVEPAVVDGTEFGVVLEPVAAKAVEYREKTERPEHDQHGREQFILRHFASLHTSPFARQSPYNL